jgi:hypothetical protein
MIDATDWRLWDFERARQALTDELAQAYLPRPSISCRACNRDITADVKLASEEHRAYVCPCGRGARMSSGVRPRR